MARKKAFAKTMLNFLNKKYTEEELDHFEWAVDKENDTIYRMEFTDHKRSRKALVLTKDTGVISLRDAI